MRSLISQELQTMVIEALAGSPVVPAFVIRTAGTTKRFKLHLPATERAYRLEVVGCLATWLAATLVVFSEEGDEPKRVVTTGMGRSGVLVATAPIACSPDEVAPISWLPVSAVGVDLLRLRPRDDRQISEEMIEILHDLFGPRATVATTPVSGKAPTAEAEEWDLLFA